MFTRRRWAIQALIVFTGVFGALAWEGIRTAFEWVMG